MEEEIFLFIYLFFPKDSIPEKGREGGKETLVFSPPHLLPD